MDVILKSHDAPAPKRTFKQTTVEAVPSCLGTDKFAKWGSLPSGRVGIGHVPHVDQMLHDVGKALGARVAAQRQKVVHRVVAGQRRVQHVAVVAQYVRQAKGRLHEAVDRGRGHLGVQLRAVRHADAARHGRGQRRAVRVQVVGPAGVPLRPRGVHVKEHGQVERGRPVDGREEVDDERVERPAALVVLEHDAVPAVRAVAQHRQRFPGGQRPAQRVRAVRHHPVEQAHALVVAVPVAAAARQQPVHRAFAEPLQPVVLHHPVAALVALRVPDVRDDLPEPRGVLALRRVRQPVEPAAESTGNKRVRYIIIYNTIGIRFVVVTQ